MASNAPSTSADTSPDEKKEGGEKQKNPDKQGGEGQAVEKAQKETKDAAKKALESAENAQIESGSQKPAASSQPEHTPKAAPAAAAPAVSHTPSLGDDVGTVTAVGAFAVAPMIAATAATGYGLFYLLKKAKIPLLSSSLNFAEKQVSGVVNTGVKAGSSILGSFWRVGTAPLRLGWNVGANILGTGYNVASNVLGTLGKGAYNILEPVVRVPFQLAKSAVVWTAEKLSALVMTLVSAYADMWKNRPIVSLVAHTLAIGAISSGQLLPVSQMLFTTGGTALANLMEGIGNIFKIVGNVGNWKWWFGIPG